MIDEQKLLSEIEAEQRKIVERVMNGAVNSFEEYLKLVWTFQGLKKTSDMVYEKLNEQENDR